MNKWLFAFILLNCFSAAAYAQQLNDNNLAAETAPVNNDNYRSIQSRNYYPVTMEKSESSPYYAAMVPGTEAGRINPVNCLHNKSCKKTSHPWFIGVEGGATWLELDNESVLNGAPFNYPFNFDKYTTDSPDPAPFASLLAGLRFDTGKEFIPYVSAAFRYRYYYHDEIEGEVVQFNIPAFKNYDYKIDADTHLFSLLVKANLFHWDKLSPYVSAHGGVAYNKLSHYRETAKPGVTPRVSPNFGSNRENHFAYGAGVGVDLIVNDELTASIGYEYQDLGQFKTSNGTETWSNTKLKFNNAYAHIALVSVTYQLPI